MMAAVQGSAVQGSAAVHVSNDFLNDFWFFLESVVTTKLFLIYRAESQPTEGPNYKMQMQWKRSGVKRCDSY